MTWIIISVVIASLIIIGLLIYLIGNVYKGLISRKLTYIHSYNELLKYMKQLFELIPGIIKNCELNKDEHNSIKDIYASYQENFKGIIPSQCCNLYEMLVELINQISLQNKGNTTIEYAKEHLRVTSFSIPLYNSNVREFNRFKHLPINRIVSKILHLDDGEFFRKDILHSTTTINFKMPK